MWSSAIWYMLVGQKAPSAKRYIKTQVRQERENRVVVARNHRAPKGALRQMVLTVHSLICGSGQKAPSATRCIKTIHASWHERSSSPSQKAPSGQNFARNSLLSTLHHLLEAAEFQRSDFKHRNNRPVITCNIFEELSVARTKRSIKTVRALNTRGYRCSLGQKAPSAKRCIKTRYRQGERNSRSRWSESTERHKVH